MDDRTEAIDILTRMSTNHFYGHREQKAFKLAVEALKQRWIPVTERLPEEHEEVLTSDSVFGITFDSLHNGKWRKHPVAWMPLPEPYEVEV